MCMIIFKVVMINLVIVTVIVEINSIVVVRDGIACQNIIVTVVVEVDTRVVARGGVTY